MLLTDEKKLFVRSFIAVTTKIDTIKYECELFYDEATGNVSNDGNMLLIVFS